MRIKGPTREEDKCFAVSCEHCALAYKIANPRKGKRFCLVSLPAELIRCGILWVGLSSGHKYGPCSAKRSDGSDMTIVMLRDFPEHIRLDAVPDRPLPLASTNFPSHLVVSGWSATGTVRGSHCAMNSDHIVFVESSGEAGNNGTLVYLLYPGKTLPIGIYIGTMPMPRGADLKVCGRICPFPRNCKTNSYNTTEHLIVMHHPVFEFRLDGGVSTVSYLKRLVRKRIYVTSHRSVMVAMNTAFWLGPEEHLYAARKNWCKGCFIVGVLSVQSGACIVGIIDINLIGEEWSV